MLYVNLPSNTSLTDSLSPPPPPPAQPPPSHQAIDTTVNIYVESVQGLKPGLTSTRGTTAAAATKVAEAMASSRSLRTTGGGSTSSAMSHGGGAEFASSSSSSGSSKPLQGGAGVPGLSSTPVGGRDSYDGSGDSDEETSEAAAAAEGGKGEATLSVISKNSKFVVVATNVDTGLQR